MEIWAQHQIAPLKAPRTAAQRDALADTVIGAVEAAFQKLAEHRDEIVELWSEFASLQPGETIKGCTTKTQFCEMHLRRDIRSVQYMLKGGNFNRGDTVSPTVVQVDPLLNLPPLAGYIKHDNHLRREYLHGLGLPYPYGVDGRVIVPFQTHDLVLTALINEECRLASLCGCDDECRGAAHTQECCKRFDDSANMFMEVENHICREGDRKRDEARREWEDDHGVEDGQMTRKQREEFSEQYERNLDQERDKKFKKLLKETGCIECYGTREQQGLVPTG